MPLDRYLNVVEAVIVDRYGEAAVEAWLDAPALTPEAWGAGRQAADEQQAFMNLVGGPS